MPIRRRVVALESVVAGEASSWCSFLVLLASCRAMPIDAVFRKGAILSFQILVGEALSL